MATNDRRQQFLAQTEVINSGTSNDVTAGEVIGGQTELDNSVVLAPLGVAIINIPSSFSAAPTGPISLYMVRGEVDGATDGTALGYGALTGTDNQGNPEYAEFMGAWNPTIDEAYVDAITIDLMGVNKAKFYIQNDTGQTFTTTAAVTVDVELLTDQPTP